MEICVSRGKGIIAEKLVYKYKSRRTLEN